MTENECLDKLIPPWKFRPGKMGGGGVLQIHVTRACSQACRNCTQGSNLSGKTYFMSPELFELAIRSLEGYPFLIAIFGGQPTLSPYFGKYCSIMRRLLPVEQRGLWTNALNGWGKECRKTFDPKNCNLNCHMQQGDYTEFRRDWPEAHAFGMDSDSRHSPVFVAMKDIIPDEGLRWELISKCDIARDWSSLIGLFRGQLRAWHCEIQGAMSMLHQEKPEYPDTGLDPTVDHEDSVSKKMVKWWLLPMQSFAHQVRKHCHECSVPLKGYGALALDDSARDQVSQTHLDIYKPKRKNHQVEIVTTSEQLGRTLHCMLDYIGNAKRPKKETCEQ